MFNAFLEFEDEIDSSSDLVIYSGVTFKADFGIFKKGQQLEVLNIQFDDGTMQEETSDGDPKGEKQKFVLIPIQ